MFDVGFWELIILFGLGLVILGPERLPKVAIQLGQWAGQARRMARSLTTQIRDELDVDLNQPFDADYSRPKPRPETYKRPGVDDLKPGDPTDDPPDSESDGESDSTMGGPKNSDPPKE
jgi:sec-independent protein translocase protein TatB